MARNRLPLDHYLAEMVLMPAADAAKHVEALRITVFAPQFPQRAIAPELLVGEVPADHLRISADQRRLEGYFSRLPPEKSLVRVRYGDSLEGEIASPFARENVRRLPRDCGEGA